MGIGISEHTLGRTLQGHRKARGLTIGDLAARAGIHRTTVSRWERGKVIPFIHELTRVLDVLNVSQKDRLVCYRSLEAPRAIQLTETDSATALPVSGGELLRALRQRARVSQRTVARATNVAQSLVVKWEKGECWPGHEHLHAFCFAIGATPDELAFLTTRAWRQTDPLPMDKDALDSAIELVSDTPTPVLSGVYLAFAARYHDLYRAGKISELEATAVYGYYAHYVGCVLKRQEKARQLAAPVLAGLGRRKSKLSGGELYAVDWQVEYGDTPTVNDLYAPVRRRMTRNIEDNLALLESLASRYEPQTRSFLSHKMARTWERAGNVAAAEACYKHCQTLAISEQQATHRSYAYVEFLCRHKQFRKAASELRPASAWTWETRPMVHIKNWCNHAEVLTGLGELASAENYLAQATTHASVHGVESFAEPELRRIASTIENSRKAALSPKGWAI